MTSALPPAARGAALTLDYCGGSGGSGSDRSILETLRKHGLPATLFLNARWIDANPGLARELAADPLFELANHGTRHLPLSVAGQHAYGIPGTAGVPDVYDEIMVNAEKLEELTGIRPRFFRSGTAHLDEVAGSICLDLGMIPAGFTINGDAGATYPADVVVQEVVRARAGDIIIAHGNQPGSGTGAGLAEALPRLQDNGVQLLTLSQATS
ncbi:peptidoglycan/xylan/chitin deacetylase (PgdA/CDA1 family) [Arthrobacter pigmenti]|uniref:Peptidoglycan/xylan/chitin deacetylase (PgdA/CDA1 family) n=1 Tax=Arthrobacter pigmenti TaxID=271432 RepID=A0A846RIB6_9MICC|nr:peptidoglycan/xylan/chitin deacetylase (PgdA/CDA1 family) [Arthrobacter pigmenti]